MKTDNSIQNKFLSALLIMSLLICSCGGSSPETETTSTATTQQLTPSAFISIFDAVSLSVPNLKYAEDISTICSDDFGFNTPSGMVVSLSGSPIDFVVGASGDQITLNEEKYFCKNPGDVDNAANGETGLNGDGLFASFIIAAEMSGTCGEVNVGFLKGNGFIRQTPTHAREIYGRFQLLDESIIDCTLRFDDSNALDETSSSCTDIDGVSIPIVTSDSCNVTVAASLVEAPDLIKGHYALGEAEDTNMAYACTSYNLVQPSEDTNYFASFESDCSALTNAGINSEFISIKTTVYDPDLDNDYSNAIFEVSGDTSQIALALLQARQAGLATTLSVDMLYVTDPDVIDDTEQFPQEMIDDETFREKLEEFILDWARFAQLNGVTYFTPISESDRIFQNSSEGEMADDTFLQSILENLQETYSGKLAYILMDFNTADAENYNLNGFSIAGSTKSPLNNQSSTQFAETLETVISNIASVVDTHNASSGDSVKGMLMSLGVWGEAATLGNGMTDWNDDQTVSDHVYSVGFALSEQYGLDGLVVWEGADGEVVFPAFPITWQFISDTFNSF